MEIFPIDQTNICHIELTVTFISNRIFTVITFLAGMKLSCRVFWIIVKIHLKLPIQMLFAVIGWHSEEKERRKEFKPKMMKSGMDTVQRKQQFVFKIYILLTSSNNQFSEFPIFCLFTFLFIFLLNTFFFEAHLERVIDGTAGCWPYFWSSKK